MDYLSVEEQREFLREINMSYLKEYASIHHYTFDITIDRPIAELKKELDDLQTEFKSYNVFDIKDGVKAFKKHKMKMLKLRNNISFIEGELLSLYEVKIIYAYKYFEINIKQLIEVGYEDISSSKIYKWEDFKVYFKSKGINLNTLNNYSEMDQLRQANNSFKHSGTKGNKRLNFITEFNGKNILKYQDLEKFYNRVKEAPKQFIQSLASAISDELYVFDDNRIVKNRPT